MHGPAASSAWREECYRQAPLSANTSKTLGTNQRNETHVGESLLSKGRITRTSQPHQCLGADGTDGHYEAPAD